ncbi:hypothetical protein ACIP79_27415 [Streptomyces sp. NPDC088747]|uniref:hypothetical protein n=1 Tax=Streptomyces sp. NPDC088747 TaxID=3365886 RepID=UPI00382F38BA
MAVAFRISGVNQERQHFVEVDEYVPLTVQWSGYSRLRTAPRSVVLDLGVSLVGVKTDRDSGEVVEVVLVEISRPLTFDVPRGAPVEAEPGIPLVYYEENPLGPPTGEIRLYSDGLRIRLAEGCSVRQVGDSEAAFGFSEAGYWVDINVRLDPEKMTGLRALCGPRSL